ncbi:MAG TPA: hypothetical protein VFQ43_18875 [Nitrososphaera sp.]|nr:hypothetical protein [Nitrososphaera sp.]
MIAETEHLQRPELVEQDSPCVIAPWEENPYQLVSWWKMQEFSAATFYHIATNLCQFQVAVERERTADDAFEKELFHSGGIARKTLTDIRQECEQIGLTISIKCINDLIRTGEQGTSAGIFKEKVAQLSDLIRWEMEEKLFLYSPPERAKRYDQANAFGTEVAKQFSSTGYDVLEAGNCFAANRPTACVFHLMRVLELGLIAFAKLFPGIPTHKENWQQIIQNIESAIRAMPHASAKAADWKETYERYSQVASGFMFFKDAWRNYTAHKRGQYTPEQADGIYRNVQAFMQRLAEMGLHE